MASVFNQKIWEDPSPGTLVSVPAGEPLELLFTCSNDAEKVVTFTARVDGLGPWGPDTEPRLPVVPFESGQIRLAIKAPVSAEPGDYPFSVSLFLNGDPVEPNGTTALVMRLLPALAPIEAAPIPEPEPPTVKAEPVAETTPTTIEAPTAAPEATVSIDEVPAVAEEIGEPREEKPKAKKSNEPKAKKPKSTTIPTTEADVTAVPADAAPVVDSFVEPAKEEEAVPEALEPATEPIPVQVPPKPMPEPEPEPEPAPEQEPVPAPEPTPEPNPVPEPPRPEPEKPKPTGGGPKLIDLAPPPIPAKPQPEPEPEPEPIPEPEPEPIPVPIPTPEPVTPRVVDYGTAEEETEELEDVAAAYPADHVFANPKEGTVLYARPGETILVRFSVSNDQSGVRTYVLQEDRSLDSEWIALVRDQVNITPGGTGDVAFLLKPPIHAEPASYPFSVSFGVLGKPLSSCYLTLTVQPAPAVTLSSKKAVVSVGPFSKRIPFELQVESAGNSDTAYRLAVIDDSPTPDGQPQEPVPIYEAPAWQYLFDKEVENIASPSSGRIPPPVPHRLTLQRKGTWWFGWREKHKVKLAAVPVTDKANNLKRGNVIELTGSRWRIFPLPMFLMIPLFFIALVMLGSGGNNLRVTNGIQGDDGAFYVIGSELGQQQMDVRLKWNAPIYAMVKLNKLDQGRVAPVSASRESASDKATVQDYGQAQKISYELGSRFFGPTIKSDVRFVPMKTDGMLQITVGAAAIPFVPGREKVTEDMVEVNSQTATIDVKRGEIKQIVFRNLTGTGKINGQTVIAWTMRQPQGFKVNDFMIQQGSNQPINMNSVAIAKISVNENDFPPDGEAIWEILTTDAKNQLVRLKLRVVE